MAVQDSITILHLSDPQFGRNHRFGNFGLTEKDLQFDTLFQRLSDDLTRLENQEHIKPQIVVVSGDLAEWGRKSEFEDVLTLLIKLTERLNIPRRQIVIVPGNHDVNRKLCESYFSQCEGREEKPLPPYWPKWEFYYWLFQQFYGEEKDITSSLEEPWAVWELEELNLVVAGLNSTMAESHQDTDHYGWVGEAQLRWFAKRLEPFKERGWFRLGVVHHNVQRGAVADDENLRDADDLQRILAPSLNLLLHGHTHNSKLGWLSTTLPVLSTGSAAVGVDQRAPEVPNQYQIIRLWPKKIERWTRRYDPEQKRWIADPRCSEDGNTGHIEHKRTFNAVAGTFSQAPKRARSRRTTTPTSEERQDKEWDRRERRDDFLTHVIDVCKLRYPNAEIDVAPTSASQLSYLRVAVKDGPVSRLFPLGICESGLTAEWLTKFQQEVVAQYRARDPHLQCEVVYGGDRVADELIRTANAQGVRLSSFIEFQGLIDFHNYLKQQTQRLANDPIYPPKLYVPQHLVYEIGRREHSASDAVSTITEWLREPLARFVLVLGNFGTGKTFLLHELVRRMPSEIPHLVPVLVELRTLEKARTFEQLIAQHLAAVGERHIDLDAFPYMLREGRIALLFDGFDELAQRVTYQRATEHFETLIQAAAGRAKVVVTSRTQHFETDQQIKTALYDRTQTLPGLHLARLQAFEDAQILQFLENQLGNQTDAASRLSLIRDIQDLRGLSANPRMLSFIANLLPEQLREAQSKSGTITSAHLYRLLIEQWLKFEYERAQPRGAAPTLSVQERWDAVTAVAVALWPRLERTIDLSELTEKVAQAVTTLTALQYDTHTATHTVGSGTLLIRDEAGRFSFVHQSIMEWLVANHSSQQLRQGTTPEVLATRDMSPLMADFFCDLAGHDIARQWATATITLKTTAQEVAKNNALLVTKRLGIEVASQISLTGQDLRGKDFTQQQLIKANFAKADLREARFVEANLAGANFSDARLEDANLARANLHEVNLTGSIADGASFLGTNLQKALLTKASLRRAKLVGAQLNVDALAQCDLFGSALPAARNAEPMLSSASPCNAVAVGPDHLLASGHEDGTVRLWDIRNGQPLRTLQGHTASVWSVTFSPDGTQLASGSTDNTIRLWDVKSGTLLATFMAAAEGWVAFTPTGRYRLNGNLAGGFWYVISLCRFEPGELDPFLPEGTLRQLGFDGPLLNKE